MFFFYLFEEDQSVMAVAVVRRWPSRGVVAAAACISLFGCWTISASVFSITVLFIFIPGICAVLLATLLVAWILRGVAPHRSTGLRRDLDEKSRWYVGGAAVSVAAAFLAIAIVPASIVFTFSPWTLPESGATLVKLGAVSDTAVRVWLRAPDSATFAVSFRRVADSAWDETTSVELSQAHDHIGVAQLDTLRPNTEYVYRVKLNGAPRDDLSGSFKTLPVPGSASLVRFAFGSCAMKSLHAGYDMRGFDDVARMEPHFLLMLGDLIYADVPMSLIGLGQDASAYRAHYRRTFSDKFLATMGRSIPTFFQYDDHEIINDMQDATNPIFRPAVERWREYAGRGNPPNGGNWSGGIGGRADIDGFEPTYYAFAAGGACIFVADTRGHRTKDSILGPTQTAELYSWLLRSSRARNGSSNECTFKIIASPVPVTPNYDNRGEGWRDYADLVELLAFGNEHNGTLDGLLFISGDAHMQGVYELAPGLLEISSSPISTSGVPFLTISGKQAQIVWEQSDFGSGNGEQVATVDVDMTAEARLVIRLYSGRTGSEPRLALTITPNGGWAITGGTQAARATAKDAAAMAAGGVPLYPPR